jgi:hypothetical protein
MASIHAAVATRIGSRSTRGYYLANQCLVAGTSPFKADICAGAASACFEGYTGPKIGPSAVSEKQFKGVISSMKTRGGMIMRSSARMADRYLFSCRTPNRAPDWNRDSSSAPQAWRLHCPSSCAPPFTMSKVISFRVMTSLPLFAHTASAWNL